MLCFGLWCLHALPRARHLRAEREELSELSSVADFGCDETGCAVEEAQEGTLPLREDR